MNIEHIRRNIEQWRAEVVRFLQENAWMLSAAAALLASQPLPTKPVDEE